MHLFVYLVWEWVGGVQPMRGGQRATWQLLGISYFLPSLHPRDCSSTVRLRSRHLLSHLSSPRISFLFHAVQRVQTSVNWFSALFGLFFLVWLFFKWKSMRICDFCTFCAHYKSIVELSGLERWLLFLGTLVSFPTLQFQGIQAEKNIHI